MKLIIATAVLALTTGVAFAQDATDTMPKLPKPGITLIDAAAIADKAGTGDLVAMELDYVTQKDPVYLADLESDTGFARLMIDGDSGEVLATEIINAKTEDAMLAYMENYSSQAEIAEMAALLELIDDDAEEFDLSEEDLEDLTELLRNVDENHVEDIADDAAKAGGSK